MNRGQFGLSLVKPLSHPVLPALVQDCFRRFTLRIGIEGDLSVDHLEEELPFAFGEQLELRLSRELQVKLIAVARDCQNGVRPHLVAPDIAVESLGVNRDLFMLLGRLNFQQRVARVEQVASNVVGAFGR